MTKITLAILIISALLIFAAELATIISTGWYIGKKTASRYMDLRWYRLNLVNPSILSINTGFIAPCGMSLLCKYYIEGVGIVPRWSKLHKRINEYYRIATEKAFKIEL